MQDRETGEVMMNGFDMEYSNFRSKASDVYSKLSNLRSKLSDGHPKLFMDTTIACCEHYISSIQIVSQLSVQIVTD